VSDTWYRVLVFDGVVEQCVGGCAVLCRSVLDTWYRVLVFDGVVVQCVGV
jgi:hypothetical protein